MDNIITFTIEEHIKILNALGYEVDYTSEDIPKYKSVNIYKDDKIVGDIAYEEKNMFYLYRDNRIVGNRDLSLIKFNKRKEKNIRSVIHLRIHDKRLIFNGYNQLISEDRPYISITDKKTYEITKYIDSDEVIVQSLSEDISDDDILDYLIVKKKDRNKKLTYKIEGE